LSITDFQVYYIFALDSAAIGITPIAPRSKDVVVNKRGCSTYTRATRYSTAVGYCAARVLELSVTCRIGQRISGVNDPSMQDFQLQCISHEFINNIGAYTAYRSHYAQFVMVEVGRMGGCVTLAVVDAAEDPKSTTAAREQTMFTEAGVNTESALACNLATACT
jgi:hypothetical protein